MSSIGAPLNFAVTSNWAGQSFTGRLEVFRADSHGTVFHNWQTAPNNGWSGWNTLNSGQHISQFAVGQKSNGCLEMFAVNSNQAGFFSAQSSPGSTTWSNWSPLPNGFNGQNPTQMATPVLSQHFRLPARSGGIGNGQNQDNLLQLFASWPPYESTGTLMLSQEVPFATGFGDFLPWIDLGDNVGDIAAVGQNADGHLEAFTIGNGIVWHMWQKAPNANSWQSIEFLGSNPEITQLAVGQNSDGRLEAFGITSHGTLLHIWETVSNNSNSWGPQSTQWTPLGSGYQIAQFTVGQNSDGRLEVFAVDRHGTTLHLWQVTPGGAWSEWSLLGSGHSGTSLVVGQDQAGYLEVFDMDGSGTVFHIWQSASGAGGWSNWVTL